MSESAAAALKNDSGVKRIKIRWMKQMVPLSNRENVEDDMTRIKEKVEKGRTARKGDATGRDLRWKENWERTKK